MRFVQAGLACLRHETTKVDFEKELITKLVEICVLQLRLGAQRDQRVYLNCLYDSIGHLAYYGKRIDEEHFRFAIDQFHEKRVQYRRFLIDYVRNVGRVSIWQTALRRRMTQT